LRVDAIYKAILQREAVEGIERQRNNMIAAIFSNPTWDEHPEKRTERIRDLDTHFNDIVELVYNPKKAEPDIDWDNPFWSASKRNLEKTRAKYSWAIDGKQMREVIEPITKEQLEARERGRKAIDQT